MKKDKISENYLEKKPKKNSDINWSEDENSLVTLEMENKGIVNRIAQKLIKKPKVSYIHLDELGSFVWLMTDGERDILEIGECVKERFGDKAEPLYERLAQYVKSLEGCGFIKFE